MSGSISQVIKPDQWSRWDRFVASSSDAGFMQTSWWADFRLDAGYEHFAAILKQRGDIVGGAVIMKLSYAPGRCFYYIPEGPILPGDKIVAAAVFRAIIGAVEDARRSEEEIVSHLRIEPRWESQPSYLRGFRSVPAFMDPYMEPRNTLCIDLRRSEDEILAQMKPKGRYNVRLARRRGVSVTEDCSERGLADFMRLYEEMCERQGLDAKPAEYFESLLGILKVRGLGSLFFAEYKGERIATALAVWFGGRATYFFGASSERYRNVMAPYLLHFEVMRRAKRIGCAAYDFWGVAPPGTQEHPWTDISVFKRKFGGRDVSLVPTMDYVFDEHAYNWYIAEEGDRNVLSDPGVPEMPRTWDILHPGGPATVKGAAPSGGDGLPKSNPAL